MKNKVRKFIAGFFLTMLIPVFLGGQFNRPAPQPYKAVIKMKQMTQAEDFQRVNMEEALSILP